MKFNMGVQELMLLAMLLFSFCSPASFSPVSKNLVPVNTHENMGGDGEYEKDSMISGDSKMVNESKYTTAVKASRGGGRAGRNGGSLIPVYTAGGGAGQNRIYKGAAPCRKEGSTVLIAMSASLLLHISMYKL